MVFVQRFRDVPYTLSCLEYVAKEMDTNIVNLLCDWEDLEETLKQTTRTGFTKII